MKLHGLALIAGLASALGFQPIGWWPSTLAAFAALLWLVGTAPRLGAALARGWWFGFGQFVLGLNWIATAFTYQAAMPAWLGWVAVVLLACYLAIYPAVAAGLAWRWHDRRPGALVLLLAAAWIVTEWLRGTMFTGFAWNPIGVIWVGAGTGTAAGLAAFVGTYALGGLTVIAGGGLYLLWKRRWWQSGAIAAACLAAVAAPGQLNGSLSGGGALLRIVQPDIGQQNKWDPGYAQENFRRLAHFTGRGVGEPRLVLWPEASTPDYISYERAPRRRLAALIGPTDLLLLGGVEPVFNEEGRGVAAYNRVYALSRDGAIRAAYDKAHLVPYGEYLPMRPLLSAIGLSRLAPGSLDFLAGPGPRSIDLGRFGRAGVQICYEIVFSGEVVDRANRPDFIFNPSNDAWFGAFGPPQHLAQARLRAIEEGLPVVRATPTGISAVIDANGHVLASLPAGAGAIDARLPGRAPPTLFARHGNILALAVAFVLALAGAVAVRREAR